MRYTIVHRMDEVSQETSEYIYEKLEGTNMIKDVDNPELIVVVGGDGTFLVAMHRYIENISNIIMVGIHTGTLGFFADFQMDEVDYLIDCILNKKPEISTKRLLEIETVDQERSEIYYALNEARIENIIKTQILDVYINGTHLETFRGTGLCISTQAGSTGYNRSLKAAVISEELELIQVAEITGIHHRLFQSLQVPLILGADAEIKLTSPSYKEAIMCYDHLFDPIHHVDEVRIRLAKDKSVNFARYHDNLTYTHRIRSLF